MNIRDECRTEENLDKLAKVGAYISRQCNLRGELYGHTVNWKQIILGGPAEFSLLENLGLLEYVDCADLHYVGLRNTRYPDQHTWDVKRWKKEIQNTWECRPQTPLL
jgi:hypothetical protein